MNKVKQSGQKDFRGLTIFELTIILGIILISILWSLNLRSDSKDKVYDAERKGRVTALRENFLAFYAKNNTFPSQATFNDQKQREAILEAYLIENGQDYIKDPKDSKLIEYLTDPEDCQGTVEDPCEKISLSLVLSNGEDFYKFIVPPGKEAELLQEDIQNENEENSLEDQLNQGSNSTLSEPEPGD